MNERRAIGLLITASLIVAIAIALDGQAARVVNGIGGLFWIGSTALLLRQLRADRRYWSLLTLSAALTLVLVLLTRPSDYLSAAIGFGLAGAVIAVRAGSRPLSWAATIPALWLPIHLGVAIVRVLDRAVRDLPSAVRTEPPPTSAFVPAVMIVAALIGGGIIQKLYSRQVIGSPVPTNRRFKGLTMR